jgi:F-type H+-transporting ATPase subunit b
MPDFLNPAEAKFWVGAGLLIFLVIVVFVAKAPKLIAGALDARVAAIQSDLDEAARIREEAQRLLTQLQAEREAAQRQAQEMLAAAQEQVQQFEAEAKAKLEESLARRQKLSEQRIKVAEVRAEAEVRAAAADLATKMAEQVLMQRIAGAKSDPLIDKAISQLAGKLQ